MRFDKGKVLPGGPRVAVSSKTPGRASNLKYHDAANFTICHLEFVSLTPHLFVRASTVFPKFAEEEAFSNFFLGGTAELPGPDNLKSPHLNVLNFPFSRLSEATLKFLVKQVSKPVACDS
jgi:hypothetical protein